MTTGVVTSEDDAGLELAVGTTRLVTARGVTLEDDAGLELVVTTGDVMIEDNAGLEVDDSAVERV